MTILESILHTKRGRVRELLRDRPWASLEEERLFAEPRRSMAGALRRNEGGRAAAPASPRDDDRPAGPAAFAPIRFLCEIKRASPSAGEIRAEVDAGAIAAAYRDAGASAISLITEETFFRGRPEDLPAVRESGLPVLLKDFLVDPYQVAWGRSLGADAVLLIAAVGDRPLLEEIRAAARELSLEVLVEIHDVEELDLALHLAPELIGVNTRDLRTFHVDLAVAERLMPLLPRERVRIAESGIRTREDVLRLERCGFDALLVGESLMRAIDPGEALRGLRGAPGAPVDGR